MPKRKKRKKKAKPKKRKSQRNKTKKRKFKRLKLKKKSPRKERVFTDYSQPRPWKAAALLVCPDPRPYVLVPPMFVVQL